MAESVANQNSPSHNVRENQASQSRTQTVMEEATTSQQASTTVHLRLPQQREEHRVKWTEDTVDNEFMGKKKSKCCCIYEKQKLFGESSTSEEEEDDGDGCTPHCRGHKKKCYRHKKTPHCEDNDGCDHNDDAEGLPPDGATPT